MLVKVKCLGVIITVEVDFIDKIIELKYKIQDKKGYPVEKQTILYQGCPLDDNRCLSDYQIKNESELELQLKLTVNIKTAFQYQFEIDCHRTWRIFDLKHEICKKTNILPRHQILSYKDNELMDQKPICDCDIRDNSILILSGINKVTVNLPSGKSIECMMAQKTTVNEIKTEVSRKEHIPVCQQQFNYKGRELLNQQTLESIHYTDTDWINLAIKPLTSDDIHIIVKNTNGNKHLVKVNKLSPVGSIVDSLGVNCVHPLCLCFNGERLRDEDVLNCYEKIELLSELVLTPCDHSIPVVVNTMSGQYDTFYLDPEDDIFQVKCKIRDHFRLPDGHSKLFHKHHILESEGLVGSFEFSPGDVLFIGPHDSRKLPILPSSQPFHVLTSPSDGILALKTRIFRKEGIPVESQDLRFTGAVLEARMLVGDTATDPDTSISLKVHKLETLKVKIRDLEGNWFNIDRVDKLWTVKILSSNLGRLLPIEEDDLFVCAGRVMDEYKLLCNYDIANSPEIWIASKTPNLVSQRLSIQSLPIQSPQHYPTPRDEQQSTAQFGCVLRTQNSEPLNYRSVNDEHLINSLTPQMGAQGYSRFYSVKPTDVPHIPTYQPDIPQQHQQQQHAYKQTAMMQQQDSIQQPHYIYQQDTKQQQKHQVNSHQNIPFLHGPQNPYQQTNIPPEEYKYQQHTNQNETTFLQGPQNPYKKPSQEQRHQQQHSIIGDAQQQKQYQQQHSIIGDAQQQHQYQQQHSIIRDAQQQKQYQQQHSIIGDAQQQHQYQQQHSIIGDAQQQKQYQQQYSIIGDAQQQKQYQQQYSIIGDAQQQHQYQQQHSIVGDAQQQHQYQQQHSIVGDAQQQHQYQQQHSIIGDAQQQKQYQQQHSIIGDTQHQHQQQQHQHQQFTPQIIPLSPNKPETVCSPSSPTHEPADQDLLLLTAGVSQLGTTPFSLHKMQDSFSRPVSSKDPTALTQAQARYAVDSTTGSEHTEVTMYIEHPSGGLIAFKCTTSFTLRCLKEEISPKSQIPVRKMKLHCDGEHLLNEEMTLLQYKMRYERVIKFIDILCITVLSTHNPVIVWMNGSDLVSELAIEISSQLSVARDKLVLIYNSEVLDAQRQLSSYGLKEISEVNVEFT